MPPRSRLQSYAPRVVKEKVIQFTFLASFLAVYKGQRKFSLFFVFSASWDTAAYNWNRVQTWEIYSFGLNVFVPEYHSLHGNMQTNAIL